MSINITPTIFNNVNTFYTPIVNNNWNVVREEKVMINMIDTITVKINTRHI